MAEPGSDAIPVKSVTTDMHLTFETGVGFPAWAERHLDALHHRVGARGCVTRVKGLCDVPFHLLLAREVQLLLCLSCLAALLEQTSAEPGEDRRRPAGGTTSVVPLQLLQSMTAGPQHEGHGDSREPSAPGRTSTRSPMSAFSLTPLLATESLGKRGAVPGV